MADSHTETVETLRRLMAAEGGHSLEGMLSPPPVAWVRAAEFISFLSDQDLIASYIASGEAEGDPAAKALADEIDNRGLNR